MNLKSLFLITTLSVSAHTQTEKSSTILIKGSDKAPQEAYTGDRFEIKPEASHKIYNKTKNSAARKKLVRSIASADADKNEIPASSAVSIDSEQKRVQVIEPIVVEPTVVEQVKDLVLGNPQPSIESYKEQVHPDDVRLNRIEINISPGFIYVDSKSNYSYRNYISPSPYALIGSRIWLTPMLGVYGNYGLSTGADVSEGSNGQSKTAVTHENIDLGIDFRKFFGLSRRSNSVIFGIHYSENKFLVPSDSTKRLKTKSSGLGIHYSSRFPVAPSYAWVFGARIEPKLNHTELPTGLTIMSGSGVESSRVGVNFGGEFKLSRQHQMIWDISVNSEKNLFSGSAYSVDPETGLTPEGVSIINNQVLFTFGYRWGQ